MLALSNDWTWEISNVADGTRPGQHYQGTQASPNASANTYGSYVQMLDGSAVWGGKTGDAMEIELRFVSQYTGGTHHDTIATIGIDEAGGTSYSTLISDLVIGSPGPSYDVNGWPARGVIYRFPLRIKTGSSLAFKVSSNKASAQDIGCWVILRGGPTRPELVRVGSFVRSFGVDTANSRGTVITPGTTSEGAWTQIGSALAEPLWYFDFGYGIADDAMEANVLYVDVGAGDATNKRVIVRDAQVESTATESINKSLAGCLAQLATGDLLYARAQSGNAVDSNNSVAVYGVGG